MYKQRKRGEEQGINLIKPDLRDSETCEQNAAERQGDR